MAWWENQFLRLNKGKLYLGEKEAIQIAKHYGTPLFVYSKEQIFSNFRSLLRTFKENTSLEPRLYYAMKANPSGKILSVVKNKGAWIDAVSPGEVEKALQLGFSPDQILFTGTSLSLQDLLQVFKHKEVIVNIDAEEQLELMKEIKNKHFPHHSFKVSLRWNPGMGRGFNPGVITAGEISPDGVPIKFGVPEKRVLSCLKKALEYGFIPVGLHQHLGSEWSGEDFNLVKKAVDKIIQKACELQNKGFNFEFIDFGGGFSPQYSEKQKPFPVEKYIRYICQKIHQSDLSLKAVALEPGKYLVGNAGVLLVRVEYTKQSYGHLFACVNCGTFSSVPRPVIYKEAYHHILNCREVCSKNLKKLTVAGNLCETGDVFGKNIPMPSPQKGDVLAVLHTGAYCRSMASHYNLRKIPKEIIL